MTMTATPTEFFTVGGTLPAEAHSYVQRPADDELFRQVLNGQFCYILTARQMGKSSLVMRTAARLRAEGFTTAYVDLSAIGQPEREQWYLGVLSRLAEELQLAQDVPTWWQAHQQLGAVQRFTNFLREVLLPAQDTPLVIFIDEIDSTLQLDFTDDFFAAIRATYNQRATNPAYKRLTFVLLGVAAPGDLIKDPTRTPFNIGQPIDLQEFRREEAAGFAERLEQHVPGRGAAILDRVFHWTHGHPYLTQKLCRAMTARPGVAGTAAEVDALVKQLFLAGDARTEDINLKAVRSLVAQHPEQRQLLHLYDRVYNGDRITDDEDSLYQNRLKLIGLVRSGDRQLRVRNELYRRVFDADWITQHTPNRCPRMSPWQQVTVVAGTISLVLAVVLLLVSARQTARTIQARTEIHAGLFQRSNDPAVQMNALYELCRIEQERTSKWYYFFVAWFEPAAITLNPAETSAPAVTRLGREHGTQHLFYQQSYEKQLQIYDDPALGTYDQKLGVVAACLYPPLPGLNVPTEHASAVGNAICCRLSQDKRQQFAQRTDHTCTCEEK